MIDPRSLGLYLVLDPSLVTKRDTVTFAGQLIAAGVTCLQLRWKSATDREVVELARALRSVTTPASVPLIINDRLDIAIASGVDGVHLGVDDLPLEDARRVAGSDFILGYSPESDDDILRGSQMASYLGIGPFFETSTKADAGLALGSAEFARRHALGNLPAVAIGGITARNAHQAFEAGANGIAVVSSILGAPDPIAATSDLSRVVAASAP